jgi:hypothetical protein
MTFACWRNLGRFGSSGWPAINGRRISSRNFTHSLVAASSLGGYKEIVDGVESDPVRLHAGMLREQRRVPRGFGVCDALGHRRVLSHNT